MKKQVKLIKAQLQGKTIQALYANKTEWVDTKHPQFKPNVKYRVKPEDDKDQTQMYQCIFFLCLGFIAGALLGGL
jgi:uncharacterized membrane-anchored protein